MTTNKPPYGATCTDQQHETHVLSKHDSHAKTNQTSGCEDRPSARPVFPESSGATYADRDHMALGDYYLRHVSAMTGEALHAKSAIAAELAHRDREIDRQHAELEALRMGYAAARLEIESLRGKGWQPIETAPKDGALILAAIHIHCSDGTAAWQRHAIYFDAERNITYTDGGDETGWDFDDYQYWMPLPAAPAEGESQ